MEQVRISGWQFFLLVMNFTIGTALFLRPGGIIAAAGPDGWIIPLGAGAVAILLAWLWLILAKDNPGLSIVQICTRLAGPFVGRLFALLYIWYFVQTAGFVTRNLGDFMNSVLLPRTPISVFHIMFLLIACYATVKGVQSIARINEMLTPIVVLLLVLICLLSLSEWKWERFEPIFQMNVWKTIKDTRSIMGFPFMEVISFMMFIPFVKNRTKTGLLLGIALAAVALSGIVFITIGVLGTTRASHFIYPVYIIVQEMRIAEFIERVETTIVIVWLIWIFIKLCVVYYCAVAGICQLFRLNDRTWIAIPLVLLISGLAITFNENVMKNIEWDKRYEFDYMSLYGVILPLVLFILSRIRKFREERGGRKEV